MALLPHKMFFFSLDNAMYCYCQHGFENRKRSLPSRHWGSPIQVLIFKVTSQAVFSNVSKNIFLQASNHPSTWVHKVWQRSTTF